MGAIRCTCQLPLGVPTCSLHHSPEQRAHTPCSMPPLPSRPGAGNPSHEPSALKRHLPGASRPPRGSRHSRLALPPSGQPQPWPAHSTGLPTQTPSPAQPCPRPSAAQGRSPSFTRVPTRTHAWSYRRRCAWSYSELGTRVPGNGGSHCGERQNQEGGQGGPRATDVLEGEDATPLLSNTSPCARRPCARGPVHSRGPQVFPQCNALPSSWCSLHVC